MMLRKPRFALVLATAVIAVVATCVAGYILGTQAATTSPDTAHVIAATKDLLLKRLVDPARASFPPPASWSVRELTPREWRVFVTVESSNADGVMVQTRFSVVMRKTAEAYRCLEFSIID